MDYKNILLRSWYKKQKIGKQCVVCREKVPCCLEFHHIKPRRGLTVSKMVYLGKSLRRIKREIKKCVLLCGNCHRKLHFGVGHLSLRKKSYIEKYIIKIKNSGNCVKCGEKAPTCLEFDHIKDKSFSIGEALRCRIDIDLIKEEIKKCQLLCRNCHKKKHSG